MLPHFQIEARHEFEPSPQPLSRGERGLTAAKSSSLFRGFPSPCGRGARRLRFHPYWRLCSLLPPGEGGAKRRKRVRIRVAFLRSIRDTSSNPLPNPSPGGGEAARLRAIGSRAAERPSAMREGRGLLGEAQPNLATGGAKRRMRVRTRVALCSALSRVSLFFADAPFFPPFRACHFLLLVQEKATLVSRMKCNTWLTEEWLHESLLHAPEF